VFRLDPRLQTEVIQQKIKDLDSSTEYSAQDKGELKKHYKKQLAKLKRQKQC